MTGTLLRIFRDMERAIERDEVSPEDIVEKEATDPAFRNMRKLARDFLGFRRIVRDKIEGDE